MESGTALARTLPYFAMIGVILGNATGSVLLKVGSTVPSERAIVFGYGWQSFAGVGFLAAGVLLYAWVLKYLPLYLAQSMAALQIVAAIVAASFLLHEKISVTQSLGILLISIGLFFVVR